MSMLVSVWRRKVSRQALLGLAGGLQDVGERGGALMSIVSTGMLKR
jgi:hypothetical protein